MTANGQTTTTSPSQHDSMGSPRSSGQSSAISVLQLSPIPGDRHQGSPHAVDSVPSSPAQMTSPARQMGHYHSPLPSYHPNTTASQHSPSSLSPRRCTEPPPIPLVNDRAQGSPIPSALQSEVKRVSPVPSLPRDLYTDFPEIVQVDNGFETVRCRQTDIIAQLIWLTDYENRIFGDDPTLE